MSDFGRCVTYLLMLGILAHFFGLILSHRHYHVDRFPWRSFSFEREGLFWDRALHVRRWMNRVPDMSRILPDMEPKRIDGIARAEKIERLIRETCVAELTHNVLSLAGFGCVLIWRGAGGWVVSLLFGIGNAPFSIIQRYNRPRLVRLHRWLLSREGSEAVHSNELAEANEL